MDAPVDIPYAEIERMADDLEAGARGEGIDDNNHRFVIQRFVSRSSGAVYDCLFPATGAPRCALIPPAPATK